MAIGVKIDPTVIVAGTVVMVSERREFQDAEAMASGRPAKLERFDVMVLQPSGSTVGVRFRVDKHGAPVIELPDVGQFFAVEARVSEGAFRDNSDREVQYVNLVALRPADSALDMIMSSYAAQSKKAA